jgi:hypothetical protein
MVALLLSTSKKPVYSTLILLIILQVRLARSCLTIDLIWFKNGKFQKIKVPPQGIQLEETA